MTPPKAFIIFGNVDYKGWVWVYDCNSMAQANKFIREHLKDVPWQWTLTMRLKLKGY